jgi:hypothetical protein
MEDARMEEQVHETGGERRLDPQRVARWAELLDEDAEAREFMTQRLVGDQLAGAEQRIAELKLTQEKLRLMQRFGISEELAAVHLTAADPTELERQAESLGALLSPQRQAFADQSWQAAPRLPSYDGGTTSREEWLEQQFLTLYPGEVGT